MQCKKCNSNFVAFDHRGKLSDKDKRQFEPF